MKSSRVPLRSVTVFWARCGVCKRSGALHPGWVLDYAGPVLVGAVCQQCSGNNPTKLNKCLDKVEEMSDNYTINNSEVCHESK